MPDYLLCVKKIFDTLIPAAIVGFILFSLIAAATFLKSDAGKYIRGTLSEKFSRFRSTERLEIGWLILLYKFNIHRSIQSTQLMRYSYFSDDIIRSISLKYCLSMLRDSRLSTRMRADAAIAILEKSNEYDEEIIEICKNDEALQKKLLELVSLPDRSISRNTVARLEALCTQTEMHLDIPNPSPPAPPA